MSSGEETPNSSPPEASFRPVGGTEHSWCKAVPGGTGITVLVLLLSKPPHLPLIQKSLRILQISHPILNSTIHYDASANAFSYAFHPSPRIHIQPFDHQSTTRIVAGEDSGPSLSRFHLITEHEMNRNDWVDPGSWPDCGADVFFASLYDLGDDGWALALRLHTSVCDVTSAATLLWELLRLMGKEGGDEDEEGSGTPVEIGGGKEGSLGIENYIPNGKANKPFWARGIDMLGYSLNSFRFSNLGFKDVDSTRSSKFVKLQISADDTARLLSGCESRGVKLCGLLAAAGLIAARSSKDLPEEQYEKYAVVTLVDCRSILDPVLPKDHIGFYHSAVLNTHDMKGGEKLWDVAKRTYTSFANAKSNNKHFSDMGDLNFLMCKAIDNPGLTPSSSLRTSLVSVFEEPVFDNSDDGHLRRDLGLEDFAGCASVHGVGPSMAVFYTVRGSGVLDCNCVYPHPLHSREQMDELVGNMKRVLVAGCNE